jgi:hypothetical protein
MLTSLAARLLSRDPIGLHRTRAEATATASHILPRPHRSAHMRADRGDCGPISPPMTWRPRPVTLAAVRTSVAQLVEAEIARRLPAADAAAAPSASPATAPRVDHSVTAPVITDRLVVQLMTRLRALAQEERFRAGHLR